MKPQSNRVFPGNFCLVASGSSGCQGPSKEPMDTLTWVRSKRNESLVNERESDCQPDIGCELFGSFLDFNLTETRHIRRFSASIGPSVSDCRDQARFPPSPTRNWLSLRCWWRNLCKVCSFDDSIHFLFGLYRITASIATANSHKPNKSLQGSPRSSRFVCL